jgi:hypothetical protein
MTVILALMSLVLLSGLGTSLAVVMQTELRASANYAASREVLYAADGALEIGAQALVAFPDWNALLSGGMLSPFVDGPASAGPRLLGDGTSVDLGQATSAANGEPRPWGSNNPVWQLFGFGRIGPTTYAIVWVGDDSADDDSNPLLDGGGSANPGAGVLALRAEAFGAGGAHKVLEATFRRDAAGGVPVVRMLSWKEIR